MPTSSDFGKRKSKIPTGRHSQPLPRTGPRDTERDRGIRVLPTTPWGTHYLRLLQSSAQEHVDMHIDYFKARVLKPMNTASGRFPIR